MSQDFNQFRQARRVVRLAEEKKAPWPSEMTELYKEIDQSRDAMRALATKFKDYLRKKHTTVDEKNPEALPNYKESDGYTDDMRLVKELERFEAKLFDLLYKLKTR